MPRQSNFVPDEKMQEVVATGQDALRFHTITESGFVLENGATPERLGFGGRIRFRTDSGRLMLRFVLAPIACLAYPSQTYQGTCGFDLYVGSPGHERYYYTTRTTQPAGEFELVHQHDKPNEGFREFTLNLPLFATVTRLEIGLEPAATVKAPTRLSARPVALLGGELAQGRCASRPGMSLGNQLARLLKRPVVTGDKPAALSQSNCDIVIILPDPDEETTRKNMYKSLNTNNLYIFSWRRARKFLGNDADVCFTDAKHLNDLGFQRLAEHLAQFIQEQS